MSDDVYEEEEILLGCWDCASCGARGVPGDAYECASCAAPRPEDVEFYLPDDAPVITDEAGIAAAEAGPDWQCAYCSSWVSATLSECDNCGGAHAESERVHGDARKLRDLPPPTFRSASSSSDNLRRVRVFLTLALVLLLGGFFLYSANETAKRKEAERRQAAKQQEREREEAARRQAAERDYEQAMREYAQALREYEQAMGVFKQAMVLFDHATRAHAKLVAPLVAAVAQAEQAAGPTGDALRAAVTAHDGALREATQGRRTARRSASHLSTLRATQQTLRDAEEVRVEEHRWRVTVRTETCRTTRGEGWRVPQGAVEVGREQRQDGTKRVRDRVVTRYKTERYRAQDGYDTSTYTVRVRSGSKRVLAGTTTQSLGNGRFKRVKRYKDVPTYRNETRTKRVPRYVTKTRQVPYQEQLYKQVPVMRTWYRHETYRWSSSRELTRSGVGLDPQDPQGCPPSDTPKGRDAKRSVRREATYWIVIKGPRTDETRRVATDSGAFRGRPERPRRWRAIPDGSRWFLVRGDLMTPSDREERLTALPGRIERAVASLADDRARSQRLDAREVELQGKIPPLRKAHAPFAAKLEAARKELATARSDAPRQPMEPTKPREPRRPRWLRR